MAGECAMLERYHTDSEAGPGQEQPLVSSAKSCRIPQLFAHAVAQQSPRCRWLGTSLQMQMFFNLTIRKTTAALLFLPMACAAVPSSLEGTWKEVDDLETSSTLRFEQVGDTWVARYLSVSNYQTDYGYRAGDAIIRGRFEKNTFLGQVLLKAVDANASCPEVGAGWTAVKLEMVRMGQRLHGAFVDTLVDENDECKVVGTGSRQYRLERVR